MVENAKVVLFNFSDVIFFYIFLNGCLVSIPHPYAYCIALPKKDKVYQSFDAAFLSNREIFSVGRLPTSADKTSLLSNHVYTALLIYATCSKLYPFFSFFIPDSKGNLQLGILLRLAVQNENIQFSDKNSSKANELT